MENITRTLGNLFQDNLGQKLTVALANGMIAEILNMIEASKPKEKPEDGSADTGLL